MILRSGAAPVKWRSAGGGDSTTIPPMRDGNVRRLSSLHRLLYRLSRGTVGRRLVANDMLLLTTRGRATGRPHTVPLLYLAEGDTLVVIASHGGRLRHPEWHCNLLADPKATVQVGSRRRPVRARTAAGEERAAWWPRVVAAYQGYAAYQSRTERVIPVVLLEPDPAATRPGHRPPRRSSDLRRR